MTQNRNYYEIRFKELSCLIRSTSPTLQKKSTCHPLLPSQLYSFLESSSAEEVILRAHNLPRLVCGCERDAVSLTSWRSRADSGSVSTTHCTGLLGKAAGGRSVATWLYTWGRNRQSVTLQSTWTHYIYKDGYSDGSCFFFSLIMHKIKLKSS